MQLQEPCRQSTFNEKSIYAAWTAWTPENAGCGGQRERKTPGLVLKESANRNVLRLYGFTHAHAHAHVHAHVHVGMSCLVCHIDVLRYYPGERGPEPGCRCCLVAFRPPVLYWEDVCCGLERWTHRRMMHTRLGTRLTAQAAPRWHGSWHGVAHPAATLQALCPTAGLGCCANKRRRVGPGAGGWRSLGEVRESGARGVLAHLRGAHRESIHSRNCCLDMPTAFATCRGVGCRVSAACLCPSVETVSSVSEDPPHHVGCRYV